MKFLKHTNVFDDVTCLECTSLDCFVNFMSQYEMYMANIAEKGINGLLHYLKADYIEFANYTAKSILEDTGSTPQMVEMAKKVIGYLNAINSVIDNIKVTTESDEYLLKRLRVAMLLIEED